MKLRKIYLIPYQCLDCFREMWEAVKQSLINIHFPPTQQALIESKKRLVFDELFLLQIKFLLRKRKTNKNVISQQLPQKRSLLKEFLNTFPFELTKSQENVLNEIKKDLSNPVPMSRLLQGEMWEVVKP